VNKEANDRSFREVVQQVDRSCMYVVFEAMDWTGCVDIIS